MSEGVATHLEPEQQWSAHGSFSVDNLSEAINRNDTNQLKRLLDNQLENDPTTLQQLDNQGLNPLHVAVIVGNNDALKVLLDCDGVDINIKSEKGYTALQYARVYKNEGAIRLLVSAECSIDDLMNDSHPTGFDTTADHDDQGQSAIQSSEDGQCLLYPITESYYWSVQVYQKAITSCYCDLTTYMYPDLIIPRLVQEGHLSMSEVEGIMKKDSKTIQAMMLLSILERKGQKAYHAFLRALKNEKQQLMHEDLAKKIIELCKKYQSMSEYHNIDSSFEQVTTVFVDNQTAPMTPSSLSQRSSTNQSFLIESGFHSASLTSNSIHSATGSSRNLTRSSASSNRKTGSRSHELSGRMSSETGLISLLPNRRRQRRNTTTTGFSAMERMKPKPLNVTDVTVLLEKKCKPPRASTPASGGSAYIVASNMTPRLYIPQDETEDNELFEASPGPVLFHISNEESEDVNGDEDVVEKDNTSSVLTKPFSSQTSPIDIPSRSNSDSSFSSRSTHSRKSSTSSNTSSNFKPDSEENSPPLTNPPSSPCKDLSAIAPAKPPWRDRLVNWLLKPSMHSHTDRPSGVVGFKIY